MRVISAVALMLLGGALATRCALLLSGRGRPRRGPTPNFVIAGPYLLTRNPLFAGVALLLLGLGFAVGDVAWLAAVLFFVLAHAFVVFVEEPRLRARWGASYERYLRKVPRWLPVARVGDEN